MLHFCFATVNTKGIINIVVYNSMKYVILDQIRKSVLGKTIRKKVDKYFNSTKAVKALGRKILHNDNFLSPIASYVQEGTIDPITANARLKPSEPRLLQTMPAKLINLWYNRLPFCKNPWPVRAHNALVNREIKVAVLAKSSTRLTATTEKHKSQVKKLRHICVNHCHWFRQEGLVLLS